MGSNRLHFTATFGELRIIEVSCLFSLLKCSLFVALLDANNVVLRSIISLQVLDFKHVVLWRWLPADSRISSWEPLQGRLDLWRLIRCSNVLRFKLCRRQSCSLVSLSLEHWLCRLLEKVLAICDWIHFHLQAHLFLELHDFHLTEHLVVLEVLELGICNELVAIIVDILK